jgi:hypothetical protein
VLFQAPAKKYPAPLQRLFYLGGIESQVHGHQTKDASNMQSIIVHYKRSTRLSLLYFVFLYKNRRMKPVEIVLRRWGKGKRENDGEGKSN